MNQLAMHDILQKFTGTFPSRIAKSFYLNGPPQSGKSYLLKQLAHQLPRYYPRTQVILLSDYPDHDLSGLGLRILEELQGAYFDQEVPATPLSLSATWHWFAERAHVNTTQNLVILIDLGQPAISSLSALCSAMRDLEGRWNHPNFRIYHLLAAYWDSKALARYHQETIETSFPYTIADNYFFWSGIQRQEIAGILKSVRPLDANDLNAELMFELTGGIPGVVIETLNELGAQEFTMENLFRAIHTVAEEGMTQLAWSRVMAALPVEAKRTLTQLLTMRILPVMEENDNVVPLLNAGLAGIQRINHKTYLGFHSWFAELFTRNHSQILGLDRQSLISQEMLIPQAVTFNFEAYRSIERIENTTRHLLTRYLLANTDHASDFLTNRLKKPIGDTNLFDDAALRSKEWQTKSLGRGLASPINPQIAFLTTGDLEKLLWEIAGETKSELWRQLASITGELKDIRDAVMHNQIIDRRVLQKLDVMLETIYELNCKFSP